MGSAGAIHAPPQLQLELFSGGPGTRPRVGASSPGGAGALTLQGRSCTWNPRSPSLCMPLGSTSRSHRPRPRASNELPGSRDEGWKKEGARGAGGGGWSRRRAPSLGAGGRRGGRGGGGRTERAPARPAPLQVWLRLRPGLDPLSFRSARARTCRVSDIRVRCRCGHHRSHIRRCRRCAEPPGFVCVLAAPAPAAAATPGLGSRAPLTARRGAEGSAPRAWGTRGQLAPRRG